LLLSSKKPSFFADPPNIKLLHNIRVSGSFNRMLKTYGFLRLIQKQFFGLGPAFWLTEMGKDGICLSGESYFGDDKKVLLGDFC